MKEHPKQICLMVRHGVAEDSHPSGDGARGLTRKGREEFRDHARRIAKRVRLVGVASSPLVRAAQTAEILAEATGVSEVQIRDELLPDASAEAMVDLLKQLGARWAIVGHNPSLNEAACRIAGPLELKKGAAIAFMGHGSSLVPLWVWPPNRRKPARVKRK
jgi:phosphohistidine phosphatase